MCRRLTLFLALLPGTALAAVPSLQYKTVKSFTTLVIRQGSNPLGWLVQSPDGVGWDGTGLWVAECTGTTFAKLSPTDGKLMESFQLPDKDQTEHLVWDGSALWGVVHQKQGAGPHDHLPDGRLIKIDPQSKKIVKTINLPFQDVNTMSPMGLAYDGKYFYSLSVKDLDIYRIDPETGAGVDKPWMKTPMYNGKRIDNPCGISWDGYGCFWIADLTLGGFVVMDPKDGEIAYVLDPPKNPEPTKFGNFRPGVTKLFTGSAHNGKQIWVVDELESNPLVWELEVTLPKTGRCAHPVALGESCVPGGQPYCDPKTAACVADRCEPLCAKDKSCPAGKSCQSKGGALVCLPGGTPPVPDAGVPGADAQAPGGDAGGGSGGEGGGGGGGCAIAVEPAGAAAAFALLLGLALAVVRRARRARR